MKKHNLQQHIETYNLMNECIPVSVLYRQGRYVYSISEFDGMVTPLKIDKRRLNREAFKFLRTGITCNPFKYDKD